jgi:hypothetical protein
VVRRFLHRTNKFSDLERELRHQRPEPSRELLHKLMPEARVQGRWSRYRAGRLVLAGSLTALLVVALAAIGGLGQATAGGKLAVREVKKVVSAPFEATNQPSEATRSTPTTATEASDSGSLSGLDPPSSPPGHDQYKPGCGRGDPNQPHTGPPGNHNGFPGRCPPSAPPVVTPGP